METHREIDWGEVRSLVHQGCLDVLERATLLNAALEGRAPSREFGHYILDHLPNWAPTSPELPYELVRGWMCGELLGLLGALCQDHKLVQLLGNQAPVWQGEYEEFLDIYFFSKLSYSALSYGALSLSTWTQIYEEVSEKTSQVEFYLYDDTHRDRLLREQEAQAIIDGVLRQEAYPGFEYLSVEFSDVEGLLEDGSTVDVQLELLPDSFVFDYMPDTRQQPLPEFVALFRYLASLELKDVFFHQPEFVEPRFEEFQGARAIEELWQLYRRLCWPESKGLPQESNEVA